MQGRPPVEKSLYRSHANMGLLSWGSWAATGHLPYALPGPHVRERHTGPRR